MRLSDLLKMESIDSTGAPLGHVMDVRLVRRDGKWVTTDLIVGRGAVSQRLGFMYGVVERPWLLARIMSRIGRHARVVPWDQVRIGDDFVRVDATRAELPQPEGLR